MHASSHANETFSSVFVTPRKLTTSRGCLFRRVTGFKFAPATETTRLGSVFSLIRRHEQTLHKLAITSREKRLRALQYSRSVCGQDQNCLLRGPRAVRSTTCRTPPALQIRFDCRTRARAWIGAQLVERYKEKRRRGGERSDRVGASTRGASLQAIAERCTHAREIAISRLRHQAVTPTSRNNARTS